MTPRALGHLRTAATLLVLVLLLGYAVARGLAAVAEPFPESEDPPICVESTVTGGDILRPSGVTVSVVNAGKTTGQARKTLDDLVRQGFDEGEVANQRDDEVATAQIRVSGGRSTAVRLIRTYLGGKVEVVDTETGVAGITVVVGDDFPGVRKGRAQIKVTSASTVCGPSALS